MDLLHYKSGVEDYGDIIEFLDTKQWFPISNSINSRRVQQYGYYYDYNSRSSGTAIAPIPQELNKLKNIAEFEAEKITGNDTRYNQCIVNEYFPGQGIYPHIDSREFGPTIACFTLNSGCTINFTKGTESFDKYVEPNSLYIMSGTIRYAWKHGIKSVKKDGIIPRGRRISVTFRSI